MNRPEVVYLQKIDLREINLCGANLRGANLRGAKLANKNLKGVDLEGADLRGANMYGANLRGANLRGADLYGVNLMNADLEQANLEGASLRCANLCGANLCGANLMNSNTECADLLGVDARGADFRGANLDDANTHEMKVDTETKTDWPMACPETGSFIGWKRAGEYIVKLEIPADAKRSSATTNKCRASWAKVLEIQNEDGTKAAVTEAKSICDGIYKVGEMIYPDKWDDNRWHECSHGIHFFMSRQDAVNWQG